MNPYIPKKTEIVADQSSKTPQVIKDWLFWHKWTVSGYHPDSGGELWTNTLVPDKTENGYYTWEQAVAFQLFLFFNIGAS